MAEVFADDFRCTLPPVSWDDLKPEFESLLADAGFVPDFKTDRAIQWRNEGGTIRSEASRLVRVVSLSGRSLASLRLLGMAGAFLGAIGSQPHRVTGLHATLDVRERTSEVLARLLAKAQSDEGIRAGRKRIPVGDLERRLKRMPDGSDTGTTYFGGKSVEIRPVVYDKREERLFRGMPDLGFDLTRYELRLRSGVGVTLRDAYSPAAVFWHYMAPDFLDRPADVPMWDSQAQGFECEKYDRPLPAQRLLRAVDASEQLPHLVRLAGTFPGGVDFLCALVRRMDHGASVEGGAGVSPALTVQTSIGAATA